FDLRVESLAARGVGQLPGDEVADLVVGQRPPAPRPPGRQRVRVAGVVGDAGVVGERGELFVAALTSETGVRVGVVGAGHGHGGNLAGNGEPPLGVAAVVVYGTGPACLMAAVHLLQFVGQWPRDVVGLAVPGGVVDVVQDGGAPAEQADLGV